ncbi:MAG: hypothetical protein HUU57_11870 [Bdellovibrio sp.]|nr:hypothetical protein [Bdellovibrio sp.]
MKTILVTALLFIGNIAFAGDCSLTTTRVACPGKDDAALKPYDMQKVHTPKKPEKAADEAACLKIAESSSKIIRKGTLAEKSVTAKFDGKDLGKTFADKAECK